jgi:hypothetical protein
MSDPTEREWLEGLRYEDKFPDCPGCGAPYGYPSAGPCLDHGSANAVADVPGITSCIDCGRRLVRSECPVCEVS